MMRIGFRQCIADYGGTLLATNTTPKLHSQHLRQALARAVTLAAAKSGKRAAIKTRKS